MQYCHVVVVIRSLMVSRTARWWIAHFFLEAAFFPPFFLAIFFGAAFFLGAAFFAGDFLGDFFAAIHDQNKLDT